MQILKHNLPAIPADGSDPGTPFWDLFPYRPIPQKPSTVIDVLAFERAIEAVKHMFSPLQHKLAVQVIADLTHGADTLVDLSQSSWSKCLRQKVFCSSTMKLAFPQVFLLAVGLLCAVWTPSKHIRNSYFTCYIDSPTLAIILRKGRDKRCKRTTTVLEAIFLCLINLDAFLSFELRVGISPLEAQAREIPEPIRKWLGTIRPAAPLAKKAIVAKASEGLISPI